METNIPTTDAASSAPNEINSKPEAAAAAPKLRYVFLYRVGADYFVAGTLFSDKAEAETYAPHCGPSAYWLIPVDLNALP